MRRIRRGIASGSDISDHVSTMDLHAFSQPVRIMIEMRVVEAVDAVAIEFVNRIPAALAVEQFANFAVVHG